MNEDYYNGQVLRFRAFRMKCRISLAELSQASGVSMQRISQIELMDCPVTPHLIELLHAHSKSYFCAVAQWRL